MKIKDYLPFFNSFFGILGKTIDMLTIDEFDLFVIYMKRLKNI